MNFVKEKLDAATSHNLEFYKFLDFIGSIQPVHPSQNTKFREFIQKWTGVQRSFFGRLWICHIRGSWPPKPNSPREITRQPPWAVFAMEFSTRISQAGSRSHLQEEFHPINFDELVSVTIWEEIYSVFGASVVSFIFNKTVFVISLEDNFHLCIAHPRSLLCKKIETAAKFVPRRRFRPRNTKGFSRGAKNLGLYQNPYESAASKHERISTEPQISLESRKQRKLKRKLTLVEDIDLSSKKRMTTRTDVAENRSVPNVDVALREPKPRVKIPGPSSTNPRWIVPSVQILTKIQADRAEQRRGAASSTIQIAPSDEQVPTFISVMDDKYFIGQLKMITKEVHQISWGAPFSSRLSGLKIPKALKKPDGKILTLIVHRISVTCAMEYGLRIKPKKRSRTTMGSEADLLDNRQLVTHNNIAFPPPQLVSDLMGLNLSAAPSNVSPKPSTSRQALSRDRAADQARARSLNVDQVRAPDIPRASEHANVNMMLWSPFNPNFTLSTAGITYNKRFNAKAPLDSHLGILNQENLRDGGELLEDLLLGTNVHLIPRTADATNFDVKDQVENMKAEELLPMRFILGKITKFHSRASNITKLVLACSRYWMFKEYCKSVERALRKEKKKNRKIADESVTNSSVNSRVVGTSHELVDLTIDTSSTGLSGEISASAKLLQSSSSTKNPNRQQRKQTPASFHKRQQQASLLFNISATVYTEPLDPSSQQKQEILSRKLKEKVSFACVLSTLSQILHLSGASQLLGSNSNRRGFFKFIRKSICLGSTQSALQLGQLMSLLDFNHCKWLSRIQDPTLKCHIFAKVVVWLFKEYILILLRVGFYVTESSSSRMQLEFFLRDTWRSLSDRVRNKFIDDKKLSKIATGNSEEELPIPITGALRLIPKANNLRPILALRKNVTISKKDAESIRLLLNAISITVAPNGIRDPNDLQNHWKKLLTEWKESNCPKLFYVRADIKEAYPSVDIKFLRKIIQDTIAGQDDWMVKQFLSIGMSKNTAKKTLTNSNKGGLNWNNSLRSRPCIILDNHKDSKFELDYFIRKILATLNSHVVKIGMQKYDFFHGLPQGSPLSHNLCNIYYGHMDEIYFSQYMKTKCEMFIRSVDDYLFVSPSPHRVAEVYHKLRKGFPSHKCRINPEKSQTNLYVSSNAPVYNSEWVVFCGWRFCLTNGHVVRDFSSYAKQDICSTLTFRLFSCSSPEEFILNRVGITTPLRLRLLVLDPAMNCRERILMTLFEASLMMAFRLYAACRVVHPKLTVFGSQIKGYQLFRAVSKFATLLSRQVERTNTILYPFNSCSSCQNLKSCHFTSNSDVVLDGPVNPNLPKSDDPIRNNEIFFLVYHAFYLKLNRHSSVFQKTVLPKLSRLREKIQNRFAPEHYEYLMATLGAEMPKQFTAMKI